MEDQIKELRVKIDGLAQLTEGLKPFKGFEAEVTNSEGDIIYSVNNGNSKEVEKSYDSLILAKAWLGKILAELGTPSPYKSGYKTVEDIEPTADSVKILEAEKPYIVDGGWDNLNYIEKVDWLRTEIDKLISEIKIIGNNPIKRDITREFNIARTNSYNHLSEARFWLGFELQRIKEENKN